MDAWVILDGDRIKIVARGLDIFPGARVFAELIAANRGRLAEISVLEGRVACVMQEDPVVPAGSPSSRFRPTAGLDAGPEEWKTDFSRSPWPVRGGPIYHPISGVP